MFREGQHPPTETLDILLNGGGLGDHIAALPAVLHASTQNAKVTVWVCDYFHEFARTILPSHIGVEQFKDVTKRDKYASAVQTLSGTVTPMRMHLVDYASSAICDKILDPHEKNYLKYPVNTVPPIVKLPKKFVVLTPGFTAPVREMQPETINQLADYVLWRGYTPVYLGTDKSLSVVNYEHVSDPKLNKRVEYKGNFDSSVDYSKGLNLVNKTSLNEAAEIMSQAKVVIGLDNGLLHLAGCTDVPILGGFTTVDPKYRMPYRHGVLGYNFVPITPPESLGCRFCQSNWSFVYDWDFKKCFYKDYQCTKDLSAEKYIDKLEKLL